MHMSLEMQTPKNYILNIVRDDPRLRDYTRFNGHLLTHTLKKGRRETLNACWLSTSMSELKIIFSDENIFSVNILINKIIG